MAEFISKSFPFDDPALDLADVPDQIPRGKFAIATNIRSYKGSIQSRPGFTALATAAGAGGSGIQSIKRLNDLIAGSFTYIVAAGTSLFAGTSGALTSIATGLSGKPFTSAIVAPYQSPRPYIYIGDDTKMGKYKVGGSFLNWGIAAPTTPPVAALGAPLYTVISDAEVAADWHESGTAAAPTLVLRVNTTISDIAYDSTAPAMASIGLTSFVNVGRGIFLKLNSSEVVLVREVIPKIKNTTIGTIIYDSGSTGGCSIQLATPGAKRRLRKGSLLKLGSEAVVVSDVSIGADGLPSIRTITASTHAAGDAVTGVSCVRCFTNGTFSAGQTVVTNMVESVIGAGIGQLTYTANIDASVAGTRPIDLAEDEVHISLLVSKLGRLTEMKIFFNVDEVDTTFTQNYYWKSLTPNDFVPATENLLTTLEARQVRLQHKLQNAIQADDFARAEAIRQRLIDLQAHIEEVSKTPLDDQTVLGDSQFTELRFKTKELFRVGAEAGRTLLDTNAVRVLVNCTNTVTLDLDAWWIGGTYGPDIGDTGLPYHYMSRFRSRETGARSNWSPMTRSGTEAHREAVVLTPPTTGDAQVDVVDYARIGGSLERWKIIGNALAGATFTDTYDDTSVIQMADAENDEHQPFAVTDLPASGTCTVAGSTITRTSGDGFNTNWEKFSFIFVNNQPCTLSGPPLSTSKLQINENAGTGTNIPFYLPSPLLAGQKLPCVWGPFGYGQSGVFIFGVGDTKNAGTLYWTIGNNPDVMHSTGSLNVCSPSEKLQNGTVWEGRSFVFSSENLYEILPSFDSPSQFVAQKILGAKGLYAPYALCVAPEGIYHLYKDGIYLNGRERITDDLYPLFPHDGQAAVAVNGYDPPDFSSLNTLRMEYNDGYVYFTFLDTGGTPRYKSAVLDTSAKAWCIDFPNSSNLRVLTYYAIEGGGVKGLLAGGQTAGGTYTLYQVSGVSDDGGTITYDFETWCDNMDDLRLQKLWGDGWLDFDTAGENASVSVGFNAFSVNPTPNPQTISQNGRDNVPININSGAGQLARDMGLRITGSSSTQTHYYYGFGLSFVPKRDNTTIRYTDADDAGYFGAKFLQGFIIEANTFGSAKTITVQADNGTNGAWQDLATFSITHAQQAEMGYSLPTSAFVNQLNIGHNFRLKVGSSSVTWEFFRIRWVYEPSPELVTEWKTQGTTLNQMGFLHIRDMYISLQSSAQVDFTITVDGVAHPQTSIPSTSGVHQKVYVVADVMKGKEWTFTLTSSANFRVFMRDIEVRCKSWGSSGGYQVLQPFGDISRENGGARI